MAGQDGDLVFRQASTIASDRWTHLEAADELDFHGNLQDGGRIVLGAGDMVLRQAAEVSAGGDVTVRVDGELDAHGVITDNGAVKIFTDTYRLRSAHDFDGNTSCVIWGTPARRRTQPTGAWSGSRATTLGRGSDEPEIPSPPIQSARRADPRPMARPLQWTLSGPVRGSERNRP